MQRTGRNGLVFYQFERLALPEGVAHGVFTRLGGVSSAPFDSLNVGSTVGDDPSSVRANRERMAQVVGVRDADARTTWQVHGADVVVIRDRVPQSRPPPRADGIITAEVGIPLVMRFADCVPVFLYDPVRCVIGLAHAGWQGTIVGVGTAAVEAMHDTFGCCPGDIIAGIGPSIGPCCYEVGPEVVAQAQVIFGDVDQVIRFPSENGKGAHFDLWTANQHALREAGVEQIEVANLCTACNTDEFFSHRAEKGRTGRFGALIVLKGRAAS